MEAPDGGRTLVLVRHAKSSWDLDVDDHDRPLSGRGRRDAGAAGQLLQERGLSPDLVLCSTATRTQQTWAAITATGVPAGEVRLTRAIYQAWVPELTALVRAVPDEITTLLLIGHAPGVPDLVEHLCPPTHSAEWVRLEHKFPTCGIAVIAVPGPWSGVGHRRARLTSFSVPRG